MADRTSTVRVNVIMDGASTAGSKLSGLGKFAGAAALGVGALGVGAVVGANKLYDFADAQDDANASIAQGIKTMGLFGKQSDEVTKRIEDQATALSKATAVDVTSIKTTQAKLLTFKDLAKTADTAGGAFDRATQAAVDMAAKGFGTAETNAVQLGKALEDPANGLTALKKTGALTADQIKAIGDEFERTGNKSQAQADILSAVEKQVKGTAETTAGGFELMKNRLSLFGQELAEKALPYLDKFGTFMIEKGGPALVDFGRAVGENVLPKIQAFAGFVRERVLPVLQDLGGWIMEHLVPTYRDVLGGALEGAKGLFRNVSNAVDDNRSELGDLWAAAKKAAEYFVDKVMPVMGDFYRNVLPLVGAAIGDVIGKISAMVDAFQSAWDKAEALCKKLAELKDRMDAVAGGGTGVKAGQDAPPPPPPPGGGQPQNRAAAGGTHFHFHDSFIGNEVELADKLRKVLADDVLRFNGFVPT